MSDLIERLRGTSLSEIAIWEDREEAADEIEHLQRENEELRKRHSVLIERYGAKCEELEALRKDAERYRFIYGNLPNTFHAAIDAAMGEKE